MARGLHSGFMEQLRPTASKLLPFPFELGTRVPGDLRQSHQPLARIVRLYARCGFRVDTGLLLPAKAFASHHGDSRPYHIRTPAVGDFRRSELVGWSLLWSSLDHRHRSMALSVSGAGLPSAAGRASSGIETLCDRGGHADYH